MEIDPWTPEQAKAFAEYQKSQIVGRQVLLVLLAATAIICGVIGISSILPQPAIPAMSHPMANR